MRAGWAALGPAALPLARPAPAPAPRRRLPLLLAGALHWLLPTCDQNLRRRGACPVLPSARPPFLGAIRRSGSYKLRPGGAGKGAGLGGRGGSEEGVAERRRKPKRAAGGGGRREQAWLGRSQREGAHGGRRVWSAWLQAKAKCSTLVFSYPKITTRVWGRKLVI